MDIDQRLLRRAFARSLLGSEDVRQSQASEPKRTGLEEATPGHTITVLV